MKQKIFLITSILCILCMGKSNIVYAQATVDTNIYASYFGGNNNEWSASILTDSSGNVYIAGHTFSSDLPVESAYQSYNRGSADAFVVKLSPDMQTIIFCTYLGGTDYDAIMNMNLDNEGNIYAVGFTMSSDFPYTENAYDSIYHGDFDLFFVNMSAQGELIYSTYFGGSKKEQPRASFLDDSLNFYLTGFTTSLDFPVKSAYSDIYNGGDGDTNGFGGDAFAVKFNMKYDTLVFSTYLGGSEDEWGDGIVVDNEDNVYLCGETESSDFPLQNAFQIDYSGNRDGYITKLNSNGDDIVYSSYLGGNNEDGISSLAVNDEKELYFVGGSSSSGLPCSGNAFFQNNIGAQDLVIGKVNASGNILEYFSYFGGSSIDYGMSLNPKIQLINDETLLLASNTLSTDLPVTDNAFNKNYAGTGPNDYGDIFISKLNINNKENFYTSYFGGSGNEGAHLGLKYLNDSAVYVCSWSSSTDIYTSSDALFPNHLGGVGDAFFMRVSLFGNHGSVQPIDKNPPLIFKLEQNYPNPFNNITMINYKLPISGEIQLSVYNLAGQEIKSLVNEYQSAGEYQITWNAEGCGSGVYLCRMTADEEHVQTKKFILIE